MLSQDQVNAFACRHLTKAGWVVTQTREARRPGQETVAERGGRRLIVAPHGEGSSRPGTSRYGKAFTRSQVFNHVANLAARMLRTVADKRTVAVLAVPDNAHNREALGSMLPNLKRVGIGAFWVAADGTVTPDTPFDV
jgi:hypothetical protein